MRNAMMRARGWGKHPVAGLVIMLVCAAPSLRADVLDDLFLAPTADERNALLADWATRDPGGEGWRVDAQRTDAQGATVQVISHRVQGIRHYAALRYPRQWDPAQAYPALVYAHGGLTGVDINALDLVEQLVADQALTDSCFVFVPSFRSETLFAGTLGTYMSEGEPSPLDYDSDDVIGMLNAAALNLPSLDVQRVAVIGESRGGAVALHLAQRDPRVKVMIDIYGPSDFFLPELKVEAAAVLAGNAQIDDPVIAALFAEVLLPISLGQSDVSAGRAKMLRSSPIHFLDQIPAGVLALQIHHGQRDTVVDVAHSEALAVRWQATGAEPDLLRYFSYPAGIHSITSMPGISERIQEGLQPLFDMLSPYDVDQDGTVGVLDFFAVLQSWGACADEQPCPADFDANGAVDVLDFFALLQNWDSA